MDEFEVAPGVLYKTKNNRHELHLNGANGESVRWDYQEIAKSPSAWYETLRAVALAMQYGPTAAKAQIQLEHLRKEIPSGMLPCNVCGSFFGVDHREFYRFCATLNGKTFSDYQCSEECNKKRKQLVFKEEMGEDFMKRWSSQVFGDEESTEC